jgi:6-phosphogluconolactonase
MAAVTPVFREFACSATLAERLAACIAERLAAGIETRGSASLVVSGGSTPIRLFDELSRTAADWGRTSVTLADERWVEPTHDDSNERIVRRHLLRNHASTARFVGLKTAAATATEGECECARRLAGVPRPFDVVLLGMGNDGHTASLFPGASGLRGALDPHCTKTCTAIAPPAAPHARITLTLPALLDSREIVLHMTGHEKRRVYERALEGGSAEAMPIRAFLRQSTVPVTVWWAP